MLWSGAIQFFLGTERRPAGGWRRPSCICTDYYDSPSRMSSFCTDLACSDQWNRFAVPLFLCVHSGFKTVDALTVIRSLQLRTTWGEGKSNPLTYPNTDQYSPLVINEHFWQTSLLSAQIVGLVGSFWSDPLNFTWKINLEQVVIYSISLAWHEWIGKWTVFM